MIEQGDMQEYIKRLETAFTKIMKKIGPELAKLEKGLTPPQFLVLNLLKKKQCTVSEIAEFMEVQPSAITAILDRMYKSGFIVRERNEIDRRVVVVKITEKGEEAFIKSKRKRLNVMTHYLSHLEKEDLDTLLSIYEKMARVIDTDSNETSLQVPL